MTIVHRIELIKLKLQVKSLASRQFRQDLAQRETEMTGSILNKLRDLVKEIGEKKGYDLVVEKSQDVVLYAKSLEDLTKEVIDVYNKRNK